MLLSNVATANTLPFLGSSSLRSSFVARRQLLEDSDLLATLSILVYPNNRSLTATGANMRLKRYAEDCWGVSR